MESQKKLPDSFVVDRYIKTYPTELIVTLGKNGVKYKEHEISTPQVEAFDVCGAGDSFLAALAFKYVLTKNILVSIPDQAYPPPEFLEVEIEFLNTPPQIGIIEPPQRVLLSLDDTVLGKVDTYSYSGSIFCNRLFQSSYDNNLPFCARIYNPAYNTTGNNNPADNLVVPNAFPNVILTTVDIGNQYIDPNNKPYSNKVYFLMSYFPLLQNPN